MKTKTIKISNSKLIYTRHDAVKEFICERCNSIKKSKIVIKWIEK